MALDRRDSAAVATLTNALLPMRDALRTELLNVIDGRIEQFRRAVYVRDEWCCNEMTRFATDCWGAAKPRTAETLGSVAYQLRGRTVNYCPFCGVSFLAPLATVKP